MSQPAAAEPVCVCGHTKQEHMIGLYRGPTHAYRPAPAPAASAEPADHIRDLLAHLGRQGVACYPVLDALLAAHAELAARVQELATRPPQALPEAVTMLLTLNRELAGRVAELEKRAQG